LGVASTVSSGATHAATPLQWPLVGRRAEVKLFEATLADPRAHGFVIHGPVGVGKTRLADECLAVANALGRPVARATATEGTRHVPLGALAPLLPPGMGDRRFDMVAVFEDVGSVLRSYRDAGPLVLLVDDLHLLDPTSATLLAQAVDSDLVFLVATVRAPEPVASPLSGLWQRARVRRVDLIDLPQTSVETLLHLVLGAPVEAAVVGEIWRASQGNVLFVRELVLGSLDRGRLADQRGVWRLIGPLATTERLAELAAARLGELGPVESDALDLLAVWEPVGLADLEALVGSATTERLDLAGAITVRADGRRQQVSFAHPLFGDIWRERMPALKRRRILLEQVDRVEQRGSRRREDPLRTATARVDATGGADGELLVQAARLARYGRDFPLVERLARAALVEGMTPAAGLLLGEALHELGRFEEAEDVLAAAEAEIAGAVVDSTAPDDLELFVLIVSIRCLNMMWGLHRHDDALADSRAARERLGVQPATLALLLNEATLLSYAGRPQQALDALAPIAGLTDPRAVAGRAVAEIPALISVGRPESAIALAREAFAQHRSSITEPIAIADATLHQILEAWALGECGRIAEAAEVAERAYGALPPTDAPDSPMWLAFQRGRAALLAGQPVTARRWLSEAAARCDEHHFAGPRRLSLSYLATAHAWLGDAAAATDAVRELDALPEMAFARAEQELGRAWAAAAAGDVPRARLILLAAADGARSAGYRSSEALLLHEVVRLGEPSPVAERLEALAAECEGPLVGRYAQHARAAAGGRVDELAEVGDAFAEMGAFLLASEALSEAGRAAQRGQERRRAAGLFARAEVTNDHCEGARTPGLASPTAFVPLTSRELDVATLAARGETSKEIAERLFLSVRTVNNHLQHIYTKLGVNRRRDLAAALEDLDVGE
jgi:DNA-binding CsgD family transcriptional regulator